MSSDARPLSARDDERDAHTVRLLRARDPEALTRLLTDHAPRVSWLLRREFRMLGEAEVDEALNAATLNAWSGATGYDESRGTLRAWFYVIARNAALGILRRELRERRGRVNGAPELNDFAAPVGVEVEGSSETQQSFVDDLHRCVSALPALQRSIIEADLRVGDVAEAAELAREYGTSKNSIYVSRSMARKTLRRCLLARGHRIGEQQAYAEGEAQ
jgi:RNA polymerase sigma factor (sigma-70 family)